jgi:Skp family chaperone for outer membrane proteins
MRRFFHVGGVLLIVAALALAGRSWSQTKPAPQPRSRIALVNLTAIVKQYEKATAFQKELKAAVEPFKKKDTQLRAEYEALHKQLRDPDTAPAQRDQIEKQMKGLQEQIDDNQVEFKKVIGEKQDQQLVILYRDIQDAATRYAKAHDIELVLHYNDATTNEDFWNPLNVARKLQAGACMPLYAMTGMDISNEVLAVLNEKKREDPEGSEPGKP